MILIVNYCFSIGDSWRINLDSPSTSAVFTSSCPNLLVPLIDAKGFATWLFYAPEWAIFLRHTIQRLDIELSNV